MTGPARSRRTGRAAARFAAPLLLLAAACGPDAPALVGRAAGSNGERVAATNGDRATNGRDAEAGAPASDLPAAVAEGIRVYRAQYCGTCHQSTLAGTAGIFGPSHDGLRATAERRIRDAGYTGTAPTAEEYVRESVLQPGAYRVRGYEHTRFLMPAYTQLTDAELDALVRMLLWQPMTEGERP